MNIRPHLLSRRLIKLLIILSVVLAACLADYVYSRERVYTGVYINDLKIGGMAREMARQSLLRQLEKERFADIPVIFRYLTDAWSFSCEELGVEADVDSSLDAAMSIGRKGSHILHYPARIRLLFHPVSVPMAVAIDKQKFGRAMNIPAQAIYEAPVNAQFILTDNGNHVDIIPDVSGRELDMAETLQHVQEMLDGYPPVIPIELADAAIPAEQTALDLESLRVRSEIASFVTTVSQSDLNRVHNISLASSALDGTLVKPYDDFSFNGVVGAAGAEQGYKPAPVILDGQLVEGIGGGICQVSSTLYNAILLADLHVVERANHSLVVGYLPPGMDATVAYGWRDLKFLNNKDHAVWIRTFISGNQLLIRLYGDPVPGQEVSIFTSDLKTIKQDIKYVEAEELPDGVVEVIKEGQPGYRITVWRVSRLGGVEVKREKISQDVYSPVAAEYRIGKSRVPVAAEEDDLQENTMETGNP
jgi:vancomycin resistance protein YoaR